MEVSLIHLLYNSNYTYCVIHKNRLHRLGCSLLCQELILSQYGSLTRIYYSKLNSLAYLLFYGSDVLFTLK